MPRLKLKPHKSPYTYMPNDAIRKVINGYLADNDKMMNTILGPGRKSMNEVKWLLYDMFISGMPWEEVLETTCVSHVALSEIYAEVGLVEMRMRKKGRPRKYEPYNDVDKYSLYYDLFEGDKHRLVQKFEHWGQDRFNAAADIFELYGNDRVELFLRKGLEDNYYFNQVQKDVKGGGTNFSYTHMLNPKQRWRLVYRDNRILDQIVTCYVQGKNLEWIAESVGIPQAVIDDITQTIVY